MIEIPATKQPNKFGGQSIFIIREIDKDITINLRDWFIQMLPPEDNDPNGLWRLVMNPRREMRERVNREAALLPPERSGDR